MGLWGFGCWALELEIPLWAQIPLGSGHVSGSFLLFCLYCGRNTYYELYPLTKFYLYSVILLTRHSVVKQFSRTYLG